MEATVEISLYPLKEAYEPSILEFIAHLKTFDQFEVRVNETSTHLFGDVDAIFEALSSGMKRVWLEYHASVFVVKFLGVNLKGSAYEL